MEPEDSYRVEGVYQSVNHREDSDTDCGGAQGHESFFSTHSPTPPPFSSPVSVGTWLQSQDCQAFAPGLKYARARIGSLGQDRSADQSGRMSILDITTLDI